MDPIQLKEKILDDGDVVEFVPITHDFGRAEFMCCPVYKYGKLKEFYIYHAQQENVEYYYKVIFSTPPLDFSITSYGCEADPKIWIHFWCKEHKSNSFRFYVPRDSHKFRISKLSNFSVQLLLR